MSDAYAPEIKPTEATGHITLRLQPIHVLKIMRRKFYPDYVVLALGGKTYELQEGDRFVATVNGVLDEFRWTDGDND